MILPIDQILLGDCVKRMKALPEGSFDCIVTSPPYFGQRDYKANGQLGLEDTPQKYVGSLLRVFDEAMRTLKPGGTCWVVLGDTYGGSYANFGARAGAQRSQRKEVWPRQGGVREKAPPQAKMAKKSLIQTPQMFQLAMTYCRGWILRNVIIWHKPGGKPESVKDRFTVDFEYLYFFTKSHDYYFNQRLEERRAKDLRDRPGKTCYRGEREIRPPGTTKARAHPTKRNKRSVWSVNPKPYKGAHFATFPQELIETAILAGCPKGGVVLDPFMGTGTTAEVAIANERHFVGIELNPGYIKLAYERLAAVQPKILVEG